MGRPAGSKNNTSFLMPWRPLTWKPIYDVMVALHCAGHSNVEIAEHTDYSAVQVGNILRSPEAKKKAAEAANAFTSSATEGIQRDLQALKSKAVERITAVIMNDAIAEAAPFRVMDASMSLLKGLGTLNGDGEKKEVNNTVIISDEVAKKLFDGAALADRVKQLHSGS